jgi:hypothetical protein
VTALLSFIPWEWLAGAAALVGGMVATWMVGRRSAKTDAKIDALKDEVEAHEIRNEVEAGVDRGGDPADRLREQWGRD